MAVPVTARTYLVHLYEHVQIIEFDSTRIQNVRLFPVGVVAPAAPREGNSRYPRETGEYHLYPRGL